jgi:hypothetical protein
MPIDRPTQQFAPESMSPAVRGTTRRDDGVAASIGRSQRLPQQTRHRRARDLAGPLDMVLPRLHRVKRTSPGKWLACCPAHDDGSPSLSLKEGDDGRVLLKCWAGCSAVEVVTALGLTMSDLFPPPPDTPGSGHAAQRRPWSAGDLIELAAHESSVAMVIAADVLRGRADADLERLLLAAGRLADLREAVHANR